MISDLARCCGILLCAALIAGLDTHDGAIRLELNPRICTLAAKDRQCSALVHARWQSDHDESLCLVIVGRPDVKRCWEHYTKGVYSIELVFSDDVTFELEDTDLTKVLASDVLRVIREAIHYRRKRHDPWNIFN